MAGYEKVLYFVDEEDTSSDTMRLAIPRARSLGAAVTFASVLPPPRSALLGGRIAPEKLEQLCTESETERLAQLVEPLRNGDVPISTRVLVGDPAAAIIRAVMADGYQMVWKAPSEGRGLRDRILGSVDMRLIRACPCPVAIVGSHRPEEGRRVTVAAVDVTPAAERDEVNEELNLRVLELAWHGVAGPDTRLHVVHAWTLYGESIMRSPRAGVAPDVLAALLEAEEAGRRQRLEELVERYRGTLDPSERDAFGPQLHLVKGDASEAIPEELDRIEADLVVMGTIARRGVTGLLLGNTAEKLLGRLTCSVLTTKPDDFVTPVPVA
jgi:nucleotide-binding universal stress UspA family protein